MNGVITIKKWREFQHYRQRNPPWIKLYRRLLDPDKTPWYRDLSDNAARFLVELWLLASRDGGTVPYDSLMILRETGRPSTHKPLLDLALQELASVGAITVASTDASAHYFPDASADASAGARPQRNRETEKQSTETEPNGSAVPAEPKSPTTWHGLAAPALRNAGVSEPDIGDTLKNWWPVAVRLTTGHTELAAFVLWAGKQKQARGLTWNPAARWNVHNEEGVAAFKYVLSQWRLHHQGSATPRRRAEHSRPERVTVEDFGT